MSVVLGCRLGFNDTRLHVFWGFISSERAGTNRYVQCAVASRVDKMSPGAMAPETDGAPHACDLEGDMFSPRQCPSLHELGLSQHLVRAIRSRLW